MIPGTGSRRIPLKNMMRYQCGFPFSPPTTRPRPERRDVVSDMVFPFLLPAVPRRDRLALLKWLGVFRKKKVGTRLARPCPDLLRAGAPALQEEGVSDKASAPLQPLI